MVADGYKAFVNKSEVASVVKEYVSIIAVGISGAGNGKLCSQLNTVISLVEAMYLSEDMWLFSDFAKDRFLSSPRALYSVYFAIASSYYAGYGNGFVNGCLCIHSH